MKSAVFLNKIKYSLSVHIATVIVHPKTTRQARMTLNRLNLVDKDYGFKNAINRT